MCEWQFGEFAAVWSTLHPKDQLHYIDLSAAFSRLAKCSDRDGPSVLKSPTLRELLERLEQSLHRGELGPREVTNFLWSLGKMPKVWEPSPSFEELTRWEVIPVLSSNSCIR